MRLLTILCTFLLLSGLALGQSTVVRGYAGTCVYGCGPFIPLVTTPMVSLNTVSTAPVGATNATGGLVAGARNSTLSTISGSPDTVYTQPVWYSGGTTPLLGPAVRLPFMAGHAMEREHHMDREHHEEARQAWTYFSGAEETASAKEAAMTARSAKHAARTYNNQDVERQNQNNGQVKWDSKTEKIQ
jgi:hypothetical protein